MEYDEFILSKIKSHVESGFKIELDRLNKNLFSFQKFIVKRALECGRYAIFADCGLGKTIMQLEWAHRVAQQTKKPVIILCPLAVSGQTIEEGLKFGIDVRRIDCNDGSINSGIYITNYEQIDNIIADNFGGIVLDESSILKNFEGEIKKKILDRFAKTEYKLACTATPSPNDPMELGNHSEFLNVMSRTEMLAMYFVHDGGETSKWRLKGHAIDKFYQFISTWSIMIAKPSDVGFEDVGYNLPKLNLIEYVIETDKRDNGKLFNDTSISATEFNRELRLTKDHRLKKACELVNNSDESFIIWVKQNEEGEYLRKNIKGSVEVKGGDDSEYKEKMLLGFARNEFRVLITKSKIAQFGLNYQNCHNQIFASLDFSFESLYQSIRRSYRFGQKHEVNIHLITTDTMQNVIESIQNKERSFEDMKTKMSVNCLEYTMGKKKNEIKTELEYIENDHYKIANGDCVVGIKQIPNESIGFSVFSPPFADLYVYSDHIEDMGNSKDYNEFCIQFRFLVKELFRVLKSGRNIAIHCMDLPIQKGKFGFIGLRDFSGMIREMFESEGFIYHSRITIWKDPVVEMQRTKALGLLHKQVKKDATMSRVGLPDYVLVFRKDGYRSDPVHCDINVDLWQKIASPVWMDINQSNTLQGFRDARNEQDEKHICPLQLEVIERLILLYTNKGDTVFTPFMGIGSEAYSAIKMGRKAIGIELKQSYFETAKRNIDVACELKNQLSLF